MSIYSATAQIAAVLGGYFYEWVFHQHLVPLIYLAAACTLTALAWVPFFPSQTERVRAPAIREDRARHALKGRTRVRVLW